MISPLTKLITAGIGTILVMIFVFGLAESISTGFAGFWGWFALLDYRHRGHATDVV